MTEHERTGHFEAKSFTCTMRWQQILPLVDEFQAHLAAKCPPLRLMHAVDRKWTDKEYKRLRPKGFPSSMRGVYLLFGPDEQLLYVGLAMVSFDDRVWSHDSDMDRRWTDIVPFADDTAFLAPALEFFLISSLKPPFNRQYRDH